MSSRSLERGRAGREQTRNARRNTLEQSRTSRKGLILGGLGVLAALGAAGGAAWLYVADKMSMFGGGRR